MNAETFHKLMAIRQRRIIPTDGLVFYMPMDKTITKATVNGVDGVTSYTNAYGLSDVTFETIQGVPCATVIGTTRLYNVKIPGCGYQYTLSFWARPAEDGGGYLYYKTANFSISGGSKKIIMHNYRTYTEKDGGSIPNFSVSGLVGKWAFCCVRLDKANNALFRQIGSHKKYGYQAEDQVALSTGSLFGASTGVTSLDTGETVYSYYKGSMAGLRVYNRALADDEITALSREFTPTE